MLTCISNLEKLKFSYNKSVSTFELDYLYDNLIRDNVVYFSSNISKGFREALCNDIISKLSCQKDAKIIALNDTSFHMYNALTNAGYTNVYIAFGKWDKTGKPAEDQTVLEIMQNIAKYNFKEFENDLSHLISLKEFFDMQFDIIIANPPYGAIGAEISKKIKDDIKYSQFINLLPLKDYTLDLGNYVDLNCIEVIPPHSFGDADILTHIAIINKTPVNNFKSFKEFAAASYIIDKPFSKFMQANELRNHYAIDNIHSWKSELDVNKTFIYHVFATKSQHTCGLAPITSDTVSNTYNLKNKEIKEKTSEYKNNILNGNYKTITFNTELEKNNFVEFYKSNLNFINRMMANQFYAVRDDSACFPKVDWTKKWTIEKILKYYNYNNTEIQTVIDTMNKDYAIGKDDDIYRLFGEYINEVK